MQMLHHQPPTTSYSFINIHDSFINILFGKDSCIIIDMFHQFFNRFWLCFLDVLVTGTPEPIVKWQHVRWLWRPNNFHFIADCPVLKFFCQPISNFLHCVDSCPILLEIKIFQNQPRSIFLKTFPAKKSQVQPCNLISARKVVPVSKYFQEFF